MSLQGRVCVVTGGARGIGEAIGGVPDAARLLRRPGGSLGDDRGARHRMGRPGRACQRGRAGVTRTALVQKGIDEGIVDVDGYQARTPMRRFGKPEEIASAVAYLADDEQSSVVTGETLRVDGGWSANGWIVP